MPGCRIDLVAVVASLAFILIGSAAAIAAHSGTPPAAISLGEDCGIQDPSSPGQTETAQTKLELGRPLTREISRGQTHSYQVALSAGEFIYVAVDQFGVALKVALVDPNAKAILEVDAAGSARERISLSYIAGSAALYRIEVRSSGKEGSPLGRYQVKLEERRKALPADEKRIAAQAAFIEAAKLFEQATGESYRAAFSRLEQARSLEHELGVNVEEAVTLDALGRVCAARHENERAISYFEQALTLYRDIKDRGGEATALSNSALAYFTINRYHNAISDFDQSLAISRELGDRLSEGEGLKNVGNTYILLSQDEKAVSYLDQALAIFRQEKDRTSEVGALLSLGTAYHGQIQYEKAIRYYEQALTVCRDIEDRAREGRILNNIGMTYEWLGQHERATDYLEHALAIKHELKDRAGEANSLNNLGISCSSLGRYRKAIRHYQRALLLYREVKDRAGEGAVLTNLGRAYAALRRHHGSILLHEKALVIFREVNDRASEASGLCNLGEAYDALGKVEKGIEYYERAIAIYRDVKNRADEATTLDDLMRAFEKQGKPAAAIVYGKQAVNAIQRIRGDITGLDKATQQTFLKTKEDTYHRLARLLISLGRLPEAQAVIELLKEKEYSEFVRGRGDKTESDISGVEMTPDEKRFQEISDRVIELGAARGALYAKASRTQDEERALVRLEADMRVVRVAYQKRLDELSRTLGDTESAGEKLANLKAAQSLQKTLRDLGPGTVVLYTIVGEDKYQVILVTPDVYKAEERRIRAEDLRRKVFEFRRLLQDPGLDPKPLAFELYNLVFCGGKLAEDLTKAGASTLMWSLDDALRYLPIPALFDGRRYLLERYRCPLFTLASRDSLKERPTLEWRAAGLGVSKATQGFDALPGVAAELRAIIHSDDPAAADGILPGIIKLDAVFDEDALISALNGHFPVVHIASHFAFRPGNETNSFLVLGDDKRLSLDRLKGYSFEGIELLTLSACDTATGSTDARGREVESFGMLAQERGAEAVIATLWPVYDDSTRQLMQEFYRLRQFGVGVSKAEALRQAQLKLLRGGGEALGSDGERGAKLVNVGQAPAFKRNPSAPFAHPYFWAPFILIGNWR